MNGCMLGVEQSHFSCMALSVAKLSLLTTSPLTSAGHSIGGTDDVPVLLTSTVISECVTIGRNRKVDAPRSNLRIAETVGLDAFLAVLTSPAACNRFRSMGMLGDSSDIFANKPSEGIGVCGVLVDRPDQHTSKSNRLLDFSLKGG